MDERESYQTDSVTAQDNGGKSRKKWGYTIYGKHGILYYHHVLFWRGFMRRLALLIRHLDKE